MGNEMFPVMESTEFMVKTIKKLEARIKELEEGIEKHKEDLFGGDFQNISMADYKPSDLSELLECTNDDEGEDRYCYRCDNTGEIIVCPDDMCHGLGYCVHGDGMVICPACKGESAF